MVSEAFPCSDHRLVTGQPGTFSVSPLYRLPPALPPQRQAPLAPPPPTAEPFPFGDSGSHSSPYDGGGRSGRLPCRLLAVEILGRHYPAERPVGRVGEVAVLDPGRHAHLAGIGIVDDVDRIDVGDREIAQLLRTGIDDLMRLGSRRVGDHVTGADG